MTAGSSGARMLISFSLGCLVAVTAWSWRMVWADSGAFAFLLFGVPLACAALALWVESATASRRAPAVLVVLAAVSVGWSLLNGLGIGLALLLPSLLLLAAAVASWTHRARSLPT
ncbi:hypothetical protein ACI8AG_16915 [Blastococcus sp. SYSU DS0552]